MGLTTSDINSTFRRARAEVRVAGRLASGVIGVDVSMGLSQANAEATVHFKTRPSFAEEKKPIEIWAVINGKPEIIFKGVLTGIAWEYFPGVVTLEARDKLSRLRQKWGGPDREYSSQDSAAVVQNAVEAWGIASSETSIESSGEWTLGTVDPVILASGQPFWPFVEEVDRLEGYKTYTDRAGVIRRGRVSGNVGVGSAFAYSQGQNILRCKRRRSNIDIINYCQIKGIVYQGYAIGGEGVAEAWADNPFVDDPPRFQGPTIQSNLVEDNVTALAFARRMVADGNRRPETYELEVFGNPKLSPRMVIGIAHDEVETGSGRFVIDRIQHSFRGPTFRTSITTLGGNIVATETNLPPVAVFDLKLFQEAEDTGSGIVPIVVAIADGSASYDQDGETLAWSWALSVDAGTVTPGSGSATVHRAVIEGATELSVTLTVTDAAGATNVLGPLTYPLTVGTLLIEPLYSAEDGMLAASGDGEQSWGEWSVPGGGPTCLMPKAPPWGELWGADNGHLYATIDDLATPAVDLGAPNGSVACTAVWVHEEDSTRGHAAFEDGKAYLLTIDPATPAATWVLAGTLPEGPVVEIREAYGTFGQLRATAGQGYYGSEDGGATWTLLHSFDVAWRMTAGFDSNLASGLNDPAPLYAESGSAPTLPGGTEHIRGLSFGWRQPELYLADDLGNLLRSDDLVSASVVDTAPAIVNHSERSGNADGVVYHACGDGSGDNGIVKTIRNEDPFFVRRTGTRKPFMVGYGPARLPAVAVDFVFATFGLSGALDGWHRYAFGVWSHGAMPQAAWRWVQLVAHPYNKERWLALGFPEADWNSTEFAVDSGGTNIVTLTGGVSPLWMTDDGGATWSPVTLPASMIVHSVAKLYAIGWQEQSGRWFACGQDLENFDDFAYFLYGATASDGVGYKPTDSYKIVYWCASGAGGDMIIFEEDGPGLGTNGRLAYVPNDGTTWQLGSWEANVVDGWEQPRGPGDTIRGSREFWQINLRSDRGVVHWTDYREIDPASETGAPDERPNDAAGNFQYLAVGDTHLFIASNDGTNHGIYRRPHATWEPTGAPDYPIGVSDLIYSCVTDRQSRRLFVSLVQLSSTFTFIVHDGSAFATIALPDPAIGTAHSGAGGIYKDLRGVPYAALGTAVLA
jgi:hypothetical protein